MNSLPVMSMKRRGSDLANPTYQLRLLEDPNLNLPSFDSRLSDHHLNPLRADGIDILQVNVGKLCNMTCAHCHVDAGPDRREVMTRETIDLCIDALESARIGTLDLTGGAPEMNPNFEYFVSAARDMDVHVIDRCNLTILLSNGFKKIPEFLAPQRRNRRIASLLSGRKRGRATWRWIVPKIDRSIEVTERAWIRAARFRPDAHARLQSGRSVASAGSGRARTSLSRAVAFAIWHSL